MSHEPAPFWTEFARQSRRARIVASVDRISATAARIIVGFGAGWLAGAFWGVL